MNQQEALSFAREFPTSQSDLISQFGKFEGELRITPYFWFLTMHGMEDDNIIVDGTQYDIFNVDNADRLAFPELKDVDIVALYETEQGFVITVLDPVLE